MVPIKKRNLKPFLNAEGISMKLMPSLLVFVTFFASILYGWGSEVILNQRFIKIEVVTFLFFYMI